MRGLPIAGVTLLAAGGALAGLAAATPLADTVTLRAPATVLRSDEYRLTVSGTISSGAAGEYVAVRGKECGVPGAFFRGLGGATTTAGGAWEAPLLIQTTTTLRAEWKGAQSPELVVHQRAAVTLTKTEKGFRIAVSSGTGSVDRKRVRVERLATSGGWKLIRTVVVKSNEYPSFAEVKGLTFAVPKGTPLRAVLPLAQAKPCYLAGYSKIVRT